MWTFSFVIGWSWTVRAFAYCGGMKNAVSKFFMALRVLSKEFNRFRQPFPFFTCSVSRALLLLIETKEESPCSDILLVTPPLTGAFHLKKKKKNFLLLLPWRKPQKLAGSPKDLKCERKEQQDYIVYFLSCRTILFSPARFVSDGRFIRGSQYLIACVQPPLSSKKSEGGCTQAKYLNVQ